jgi:hypothetical protein
MLHGSAGGILQMNAPEQPFAEFWKFRGANEGFYRLLINQELWFSSPDQFNDPFDCQVDIEKTYAAVRASLDTTWERAFTEILDSVDSHVRNTRYGYLCVCKQWHHTLMWTHYAENHTGVALGFSFEPNSRFGIRDLTSGDVRYESGALRSEIARVNHSYGMMRTYPPNYPGLMEGEGERFIEFFRHGLLQLYEVVRFMKAECWQYEEEFRFEVNLPEGSINGVARPFEPTDLKHIVFGTRCQPSQVATIRKLLSGPEWRHVGFWRCERDAVNLVLRAERLA